MTGNAQIRVAMLGGYPADVNQIRGGVQAATAGLVSGLSQMDDLELHLLTFQPTRDGKSEPMKCDGLTLHQLPPLPRFERLRGYQPYQAILKEQLARIQPQVIHVQEGGADAYAALRTGYPTVITLHGIRNEDRKYYPAWNQRIRFLMDSLLVEKFVVRHARYLIAISRYTTDYFAGKFRPDIHLFSIPNAVDSRYFILDSYGYQPVVLFAGRVTPLKRVLDLVQAFKQVVNDIPAAQLRIAGECLKEAAYVQSIVEFVHHANLRDNVHFLGELTQADILKEYAACSLLALTSSQENLPMVIAQAMAAGKPVVATQVGGIVEMLGTEGERGLLAPIGDIYGLAEAIVKLLQDEPLRQRIGMAGRRFALENYHPDRVAERTVEVYREIIAREDIKNG